jgi:hypothetical protein
MNDLDDFMDMDPTEMSSQDIDKIIAYHRKHRQQMANGPKKRAKKETGPKQNVDVSALLAEIVSGSPEPAAPVTKMRRP